MGNQVGTPEDNNSSGENAQKATGPLSKLFDLYVYMSYLFRIYAQTLRFY